MNELEIQFEEEKHSECWGSTLSVYCAKCLFKVLCETKNKWEQQKDDVNTQ